MVPRKILNLIVFYKILQDILLNICLKTTKPEPVYAYKRPAYKKHVVFLSYNSVDKFLCLL